MNKRQNISKRSRRPTPKQAARAIFAFLIEPQLQNIIAFNSKSRTKGRARITWHGTVAEVWEIAMAGKGARS